MEGFERWLAAQNIPYRLNAPLSDYTTFKLGGPTPVLVDCTQPAQVVRVLQYLQQANRDFILIGGGSNLLVSDDGIDLPVIRFQSPSLELTVEGSRLTVSAGSSLDDLARFCTERGFAEMVTCSGIPGSVGGAVAGNAGAFGWQVGDCITALRLCDRKGNERVAMPGEMDFSYRDSQLKHSGEILLEVTFELTREDADLLRGKRDEILALRRDKHPDLTVDCCAGSFFRNVAATSKAARRQAAGFFLEQVGAKTFRIGGAGVYPKHANIIVKHDETCTARNVYELHLKMKNAVAERFGFELIPEVRFVGEF